MRKTLSLLSLLGGLVLASCSDDDGTEPTPSIAVTLGGAITVVQGQTGTTQVTVTRAGGASTAVTLTASALPTGVTATFDPATIPAGTGTGTSTLTLTAGGAAATGTATYTVTANGGASLTATASGSVTVNAAPDFTLAVTPATLSVEQGAAGTANIAITRTGGLTGAVNLTVSNLPVGVTAAFDNAAPTGDAAVLTLTVGAVAALGTVNLAVNGAGPGGIIKSTPLALTVTAPPGNFELAVAPSPISILQGEEGQTNVTISKTGSFNGPVALTVTGLPDGVTAAFNPTPASPRAESSQDVQTTSALTLTVGAAVAAQDYPLVIHGTGEGQGERTVNLTLTVTAAPVNGFTISIDPATLSIEAGQSGQATITVHKTGTFNGPVNLSATGLPTGVTVAFNPVTASPAKGATQDVTTTSVVTITVDASVAATEAPIVIHAGAEGQPEATINIALTTTPAPVSGFTVAVDPETVSIEAGDDGTVTVTIAKTGTFTQNVGLSVLNLPTGVTAAFNPTAASPGKTAGKGTPAKTADVQTTSTLTLTVANTVAVDEYPLTVRGVFEGQPNSDAELTLNVTPAPGGFSLSANPTTVSVQAGQNGNTTVLVNKTGSFTGNVTLSAVGLPAGVTAAFNPAAPSPARASARRDVIVESIATITVGSGVTPANYPFQIKGVAEGQEDALIDVTLTVSPPPGPGNSHIKYCDLDDLPIWFAYKDGNGPWTQVTGVVAGDGTTYTFDITQSTGAFAVVTGSASEGYQTAVTYGSQAQLAGNNGQCPTAPFARTLNGSISGTGATDQVIIAMGGSAANANFAQPNFTLEKVLDGPSDLMAVRTEVNLGPPIAITPIGVILRRNLNIASGGTIPVLNFGAAEAFAPATAAFTITGAAADNLIASMQYVTPTTAGSLTNAVNSASPITMHGIPADKQEANDFHQLSVFASTNSGDVRGHMQWFHTLAAKTVDLGAGLTVPAVTSLGNAPYPRYQSTGPIQAIYDDLFFFSMSQVSGTDADNRNWSVFAFRGFFTGANYTLAMEDLTSAGYQAAWGLKVGVEANHATQGVGYSNDGTTNPIVEGGFTDFASRAGKVTP